MKIWAENDSNCENSHFIKFCNIGNSIYKGITSNIYTQVIKIFISTHLFKKSRQMNYITIIFTSFGSPLRWLTSMITWKQLFHYLSLRHLLIHYILEFDGCNSIPFPRLVMSSIGIDRSLSFGLHWNNLEQFSRNMFLLSTSCLEVDGIFSLLGLWRFTECRLFNCDTVELCRLDCRNEMQTVSSRLGPL